ncbi:P1 family peptidase [Parvularcula oceani]|uniref:P1 family peptidase n=1 Tax=Parvularcula oceani TaxID=1247963 RepID=UPI0004E2089E|nr:P1 family peptidase [Parvularcula oceani]
MPAGPENTIEDIAGLAVGNAEDEAARTGVTVLLAEEPYICACDVRGGGPGTRETDALALTGLVEKADAIILSGGSVYGLAAADAVAAALGARGRGFALVGQPGVPNSPIVPAAILYDLANGGSKLWGAAPPYARLGAAALEAAGAPLRLGRSGAGFGATAGAHAGGLGSASWRLEDGSTVAALAAVNSFGSPYMPGTDRFWAAPFEIEAEFGGRGQEGAAAGFPADSKAGPPGRTSTTLGIIATDAALTKAQAERLAIMAQDGLARALRPAHGPTDGDVVFAVSTSRRPLPEPDILSLSRLGTVAGDVMARAVARGVYEAEPERS